MSKLSIIFSVGACNSGHDGSEHSSSSYPSQATVCIKPATSVLQIFQVPSLIVNMSSPSFRLRGKQKLDLSNTVLSGPKDATVVVVPLPKDTVGVIFGVSWLASLPNKLTVSPLEPSATHRGL